MATLTLPKISEFNSGSLARGTDVLANDQYIQTWLEGANIDQNNVNQGMTPTWTGTHNFANNIIGSILAACGGDSYNLGISLSSNILKVTSRSASALSSTNKAYVYLPATTAGQRILLAVTADQSLQDAGHGTPQILGRWGTTASVAWGSAMPVFIGVVNKDDTATNVRFFLTRDPRMTTTPASTDNIGIGGTAPITSSQTNIVLFGTGANTDYNSKPCLIIGSIQATIDASAGGSMTVGSLVAGRDGIGFRQRGVSFTMPLAQNGASTGTFAKPNGGTAMVFTTNNYNYTIDEYGYYTTHIDLDGDGGTDGAGVVAAQIALPAANILSSSGSTSGIFELSAGGGSSCPMLGTAAASASHITFQRPAITGADLETPLTVVENGHFTNGGRTIRGSIRFKAF